MPVISAKPSMGLSPTPVFCIKFLTLMKVFVHSSTFVGVTPSFVGLGNADSMGLAVSRSSFFLNSFSASYKKRNAFNLVLPRVASKSISFCSLSIFSIVN